MQKNKNASLIFISHAHSHIHAMQVQPIYTNPIDHHMCKAQPIYSFFTFLLVGFSVFHAKATLYAGYCVHQNLTATLHPNCPWYTIMVQKTTTKANAGYSMKKLNVSRTCAYHAWRQTKPMTMEKSWRWMPSRIRAPELTAGAAGTFVAAAFWIWFTVDAGGVVPGYRVRRVVKPLSS